MPSSLPSLWLASLPVVVALGLSAANVTVAQEAVASVAPDRDAQASVAPSAEGSPRPGLVASVAPIELEATWHHYLWRLHRFLVG